MKIRTLIILAVVALSLGSYILLVERDQQTSEDLRMQKRRVVPGLDRDRITGIRIKRQGRTVDLRRLGDTSWLVGQWRADPALVDQILSGVEFLEHVRTLPDDSDRGRMGLTSPTAVLTLNQGSRPGIQLTLGRTDPSGQGVYLEHGSRQFVVAVGFRTMLQRDPRELLDKELMPLARQEIRKILIRHRGKPYTLQPLGQGWTVNQGRQRVRAHAQRVGKLLVALRSLRATRFPGQPLAAKAEPWIEVQGKAANIRISLPGQCPGRPTERVVQLHERHGAGSGLRSPGAGLSSVACVAQQELQLLEVAPTALMDLAPTGLSAAQLARIEIRRGGRTLVLRRDGGKWFMGQKEQADTDSVRRWAASLGALRGSLRSKATAGEALNEGHVTLLSEGKVEEALEFGQAAAGQVPTLRRADGVTLAFPEKVLDLLRTDPLEFRRRQVLEFSPLEVVRLSWTSRGRTRDYRRTGDGWQDKANAGTLDKVVRLLASLRVQRFLSAVPAMDSSVTLVLTLSPRALKPVDAGARAKRLLKVRLGVTAADGGCPGLLQGVPPFWLPPSVCKVLLSSAATDH